MKKWRFVSNQNSTIVGINDAGIETFSADIQRSLIREVIQNSLDAALPNHEPVKVEFKAFFIDQPDFPDIKNFKEAIRKCRISSQDGPDAKKFFNYASAFLKRDKLRILRISDYNTTGLTGSDTCKKGSVWSRLVKESGSSNKDNSSGGSFGIGKSAAFACSDLRTLFYSSLDKDGLESNFGVTKLISFRDQEVGGYTTGTGYYSEDEHFTAMHEMANFDTSYHRNSSGTDIYVMGAHLTKDFKQNYINAVLLEFLVSIVRGKLIVTIQGDTIDKSTIKKYINDLNQYESAEIKDLIEYYNLLTSPNPNIHRIKLDASKYGKKYGFGDGECTLYLREGENLNRKILITRKAGMKIFEKKNISGSINFTGVLVIKGEHMNETFKKMEVPSHDDWQPGRCRGEEDRYKKILNGLYKYLRETVKELFGSVNVNSMDAIGANDFLPDDISLEQVKKSYEDTFSTKIKGLNEKTVEPTVNKSKKTIVSDVDSEVEGFGGTGQNPGKGYGGHTDHAGVGQGKGFAGDGVGETTGFQMVPTKKRLTCKDAQKGIYKVTMIIPEDAEKSKLTFGISGEQSDFDLPIISAKVLSNDTDLLVEKTKDNEVYLSGMKKGQRLNLEVKIDFDEYCMMEVDYYEDKK